MHRRSVYFPGRPLMALVLTGAALALHAAAVPALYSATVPDADPQQAAQSAMAVVLVRLTGARDAAADPLLAPLLSDARRYVQIERTTTAGSTQVMFDGTALRAAIGAAGVGVWDADRPLVWVVLPPLEPTASEALRTRLQSAAQARGLPIEIAAEGSVDALAGSDALLVAARAAGAAAALLAQVPSDDPGALQWSFVGGASSGHWGGSAEAAIDGVTDALVQSARALQSAPVAELQCHILGVNDLPSFANVVGTLSAVPGVTEIAIREIEADNLTLQLKARGGQAELARALSSDRLRAIGAGTAGELEYRYQLGP
jgi:hypothetical protein